MARLNNDDKPQDSNSDSDSDKAKTEFLNAVSHELRTPLHGIVGFSDLLAQSLTGTDENKKKLVDLIKGNAECLLRKIDSITELSMLMSGEREPLPSPVNIREVGNEIVSHFARLAMDKKVTIRMDNEGLTTSLVLDGHIFERILNELLSNALKFSPPGAYILVRLQSTDTTLTAIVTDQGSGVAPEDRDLIFNLFQQVDGSLSRQFDGMGIGLALAQRLAMTHHGSLNVTEGENGMGASFILKLPVSLVEQA